ncbi:MAG TPA: SH3 domain-containing C40 family peptidase [Ktedonobacteraceae bacterium]|nr:SH3 domain-containing C40 family peptidase [Ktedonobacteraceae bacterium]
MTSTYAISIGVADIRSEPSASSELVTQALMNTPAIVDTTAGEWTHITLPDYIGWIRTSELADPIARGFCKVGASCSSPLDLVAVVTTTHAPLYSHATGDEPDGKIYLSTVLPLLDITHQERLQVALPGGDAAWLSRAEASIRQSTDAFPRTPLHTITTDAQAFLGRPYLWGGTSWEGLDCSGFVQLCYRMGGYMLPRDADQQDNALTHSIKRAEMEEGDLIFFGRNAITHVALALNHQEYIHAEGQHYQRVLINSFDPTHAHYNQRLDEIVWSIKRVAS